ncbi:unnamed protein product, partial [marine sediment metagenome]
FDASVSIWSVLPDDTWAGNPINKPPLSAGLSLKGHIERKGSGTIAEFNPHGYRMDDIDNPELILTLITIDATDVVYTASGGAGSILLGLTGQDVQVALEALEDGIETNLAGIATNASDISDNADAIVVNANNIVLLDGRLDVLEPEWAAHKVRMTGTFDHEADHIWLNAGWKLGIPRFLNDTHVEEALRANSGL